MSTDSADSGAADALPEPPALVDLGKIRTHPVSERTHLVRTEQFATAVEVGASLTEFLDSLPDSLAASRLRELAEAMAVARSQGRKVVFGLGGHVIKVGLGPLVADMIERGLITDIVLNGSTAIHDLEIARDGETSEPVSETILDGTYGMVTETAEVFARVFVRAAEGDRGLGYAVAQELASGDYAHKEQSLVLRAARAGASVTVHVAVGTDTVHAVPGADGAAIGAGTHTDFRRLATVVGQLSHGVYVNVGSAVLLPEVFLKCVAIARNLGSKVEGVTTANLDMIQHYRPRRNVLERPAARGLSITGHHELTLPLLRVMALRRLEAHGGPA